MLTTAGTIPTYEISPPPPGNVSGASNLSILLPLADEEPNLRKVFASYMGVPSSKWTGVESDRLIEGSKGMWTVSYTARAVLLENSLMLWPREYPRAAAQIMTEPTTKTVEAIVLEPHAESIVWLRNATGLPIERIGRLIGVSRMTVNNWMNGYPIADGNRQRVLVIRHIIELATRRHQTPSRIATWLDMPRGASGQTPFDLFATGKFDQARYLAVSEPSPSLRRVPSWAYRPLRRDEEEQVGRAGEALPDIPEYGLSETSGDSQEDE